MATANTVAAQKIYASTTTTLPESEHQKPKRKERHRRYIASHEWAHRRERFKERHGRRCQACGTTRKIEVHHVTYDRAYSGNEPDQDLRVLCRIHHQMAHNYEHTGRYRSLESATEAMIDDVRYPRPAGPGPARRWIHRQWLTMTGRRW